MTTLAVLNPAALVTLADCEQRIERGLKTYIDVGLALGEIRDSRLYRASHETFEDYCRERWGFSDRRASQFIEAASVVPKILGTGLPAPAVESQARALAAVPEADRADVWRDVVEGDDKPTAAAIREAHEKRTRPTETPGSADAAESPSADPGAPAAPAEGPPAPAAAQEPDLSADVLRVLGGAGEPGLTVAEISLVEDVWPDGVVHADVLSTLEQLGEAGRVAMARLPGGDRWMLTPEPDAVPSTAPPGPGPDMPDPLVAAVTLAGLSDSERADLVEKALSQPVVPPPGSPATWTPEQVEANRLEVERKQIIEAARRHARTIVTTVVSEVTTVVSGVDLGEHGLITEEMVAELQSAVDLLASRLEVSA